MTEQFVCNVDDVEPGRAIRADLASAAGVEVPVAIVRASDGTYYAINDICTHGEVSLSEGEIDGCEIECWAHGGRFDIRTGEVTQLPPMEPVATYHLRLDGERVLVDVDNPARLEETV